MQPNAPILVVEDDAVAATILHSRLVSMGYEVAGVVASGEEAIHWVETEPVSIVIMDMMLSGALDGVDTARILRERFGLPVVFLTAHDDDPSLERAKVTEPAGYLVKPVKPRALRSTIEVALHNHRASEARLARERREQEALRGTAVRSTSPGEAGAAGAARARVLIINDEPLVAAAVRRVLQGQHDVTCVGGAHAALALLEGGAQLDVLISGLGMPGMSGVELHARLLERWPAVAERMIFLTGNAYQGEWQAFLARSSNPRLDEPLDVDRLRALVRGRARDGDRRDAA